MSRPGAFFRCLLRTTRQLETYFKVFGGPGLWLWARCVFLKQDGVVDAVVKQAPHVTVRLRTGTSDVEVFEKIFIDEEYKLPFERPVGTILDLGANIGLASVYYALAFPDATIVAVEPSSENIALLRSNVAAFPKIRVVHAAAWSKDGPLAMVDPGMGPWGMRVEDSQHRDESAVVEGLRVSTLLDRQGIKNLDLLKVDIEGAEKEVFGTSEDWIGRVGAAVVELHDRYSPGCSRIFFRAVAEMPHEKWEGENIFVWR